MGCLAKGLVDRSVFTIPKAFGFEAATRMVIGLMMGGIPNRSLRIVFKSRMARRRSHANDGWHPQAQLGDGLFNAK